MIDAKMVRNIATKYIYDRCPAVVGVGKQFESAVADFLIMIGNLSKDSSGFFGGTFSDDLRKSCNSWRSLVCSS